MIGRIDEVVVDCARPWELAQFWAQVLGGAPVRRSDSWCYLDAPGWTRLAFQRVPEPKATKNRLHLDVEADDLPAAIAQAEALGAVRVGPIVTDEPGSFQVLRDPEGNEWCLVRPAALTDPRVPNPHEFAAAWLDAWNAHDLDRVLGHFDEAVVFTSPLAARLVPGSRGVLRGKNQLRAYWAAGLEAIPDLRFTVERVSAGVDTIVIQYRNQRGTLVDEVLAFGSSGLVIGGHATYPAEHNSAR